jgi:2,3-diaminopropionate biosynthesis protein SbnB
MESGDLLLLRGDEIVELFRGRERLIIDAVRAAYITQESDDVSMPNCPFLRFPDNETDRIIPKPAFLGGDFQIAGLKWVASFPGNLDKGIERASATLIINSTQTGLPQAVMESSIISAYRTAASAALGADVLRGTQAAHTVGIMGCGVINFETLRFLLTVRPEIRRVLLFDLNRERALQFQSKCEGFGEGRGFEILDAGGDLFGRADIVSIATTSTTPHLNSLERCRAEDVILHISLRDFTPQAVLMADNVVDDVEHVCSNRTSLELTERLSGSRDFIRTTIGAVLSGKRPPRDGARPVMFSPFGLGILDLALAHLAYRLAGEENAGMIIGDFLPTAWTARRY